MEKGGLGVMERRRKVRGKERKGKSHPIPRREGKEITKRKEVRKGKEKSEGIIRPVERKKKEKRKKGDRASIKKIKQENTITSYLFPRVAKKRLRRKRKTEVGKSSEKKKKDGRKAIKKRE